MNLYQVFGDDSYGEKFDELIEAEHHERAEDLFVAYHREVRKNRIDRPTMVTYLIKPTGDTEGVLSAGTEGCVRQ